ncbi:MAG TPA: DotU family type IV/VI secretion system protein [Burkholderiales bacterium]|nr:DotU family type IV/VI secretion system protein [Burkholderiales bacterium]
MADAGKGVTVLENFAEFYEEVARIKLAIREGRLQPHLMGAVEMTLSGNDLATAANQRLKQRLQQQEKLVRSVGTEAEIETYRAAQYVMAALADEIFILEIDWVGQEAWPYMLLESSLFQLNNAGQEFFARLDRLLGMRVVTPLAEDLAAVFLMALQLGFKGEHRSEQGAAILQNYRAKLIQFIGAGYDRWREQPGCLQAYQYRMSEMRGERLAPLSRWYRWAAIGLLVYIAMSTVVWFAMTNRFDRVFNSG